MTNTGNRDAALLRRQIEYLSGFMLEGRFDVLRRTLRNRTRYLTLCVENTFHPQNASALVRSCEAFGIQDIHAVEDLCRFSPNVRIARGAEKWIDIHRYRTSGNLIAKLRETGYRIVVTSPRADGFTPETFDVTAGKFALFFGTEHDGVSAEAEAAADHFIHIPMYGFVESLNVSASAAILLYALMTTIRESGTDWRLTEQEQDPILFRWMLGSIRDSANILKRFDPEMGQNKLTF